MDFAEERMWPKGEREFSAELRELITVVESPSRINELRPSSCGKEIALTTPKPAIPKSGNIAPSKLILREPLGGGDHWIWELVWSTCRADQGRSILKSERDCDAWGITWKIRNSFRPTLSWFLWYHNVHTPHDHCHQLMIFPFHVYEENQVPERWKGVQLTKCKIWNGIPNIYKFQALP